MKRIYLVKVIICVIACVICTSCSDYLEVENQQSVNPTSFYKTEAQCDEAIMGIFNYTYQLPDAIFRLNEVRSDNIGLTPSDADNDNDGNCAYFGANLSSRGQISSAWAACSNIIAAANLYLDNESKASWTSTEMQQRYQAQARFLRGMAYFYFTRWFGAVPEATSSLSSGAQSLGRTASHKIYQDVIIPDLEFAVEHLQEVPTNYKDKALKGRTSKYVAEAFLGEVYMTMAGYPFNSSDYDWEGATPWSSSDCITKAISYFEDVKDSGNESSWFATNMTEWNKMWLHDFDNTRFMFEIQCETDYDITCGNTCTRYLAPQGYNGNSVFYGQAKQMYASTAVMVSPTLAEALLPIDATTGKSVDQRAFNSIMMANLDKTNSKLTTLNGYNTDKTVYDGNEDDAIYMTKFWENKVKRDSIGKTTSISTWAAYNLNAANTVWPQNFPLMRYENVLLYLAEAYAERDGAVTQDAVNLLNKTHTRAGLTAYTTADFATVDDFVNAVLDERQREFVCEGHRWFDLVRTNKYIEKCGAMFDKCLTVYSEKTATFTKAKENLAGEYGRYYYLFPVPQGQIDIVGSDTYPQNKGYN